MFMRLPTSWWHPERDDQRVPVYEIQYEQVETLFCALHTQGTLHDDAQILEVGCGKGKYTELLEKLGLRPTAIDVSTEMIKTAREVSKETSFIEADGLRLPFSPKSFDHCCAFGLTSHIPRIDDLLAEFTRVTRPQGMVIFDVSHAWGLHHLWESVNPGLHGWRNYPRRSYTKSNIIKAALENGLMVEQIIGLATIRPISLFPNWEHTLITGEAARYLSSKLDPVVGDMLGSNFLFVCRNAH